MRIVLFDIDGTLVKAGGAGRKALNRAVFKLYGIRDICSTFSLAGRMDWDNFRRAHENAVGRRATPRDIERVEAAYLALLPDEVRKAVREGLYAEIAGVSRLVNRLSGLDDVLLGLGTGNIEEGARIKLGPSGLLGRFRFGGFGRDGGSRTQMLRTAARRAETLAGRRISGARVFVIGDTPRDVSAGRSAGFRTGAVLDGFGDVEAIRRACPDFLAADFRDTDAWLRWIVR